jgi:hypothetical protein
VVRLAAGDEGSLGHGHSRRGTVLLGRFSCLQAVRWLALSSAYEIYMFYFHVCFKSVICYLTYEIYMFYFHVCFKSVICYLLLCPLISFGCGNGVIEEFEVAVVASDLGRTRKTMPQRTTCCSFISSPPLSWVARRCSEMSCTGDAQ